MWRKNYLIWSVLLWINVICDFRMELMLLTVDISSVNRAIRKGKFTYFQNVNGLYSETHKPVEKLRTLIKHKCNDSFHLKSWFPTTWWNYLKTWNTINVAYKYRLPIAQFLCLCIHMCLAVKNYVINASSRIKLKFKGYRCELDMPI